MHCHKHVDVPIVCLTFTSETHTFFNRTVWNVAINKTKYCW